MLINLKKTNAYFFSSEISIIGMLSADGVHHIRKFLNLLKKIQIPKMPFLIRLLVGTSWKLLGTFVALCAAFPMDFVTYQKSLKTKSYENGFFIK